MLGATTVGGSKASWADLDILCATALHKDITHRYRSVEALIRNLDHYAKGEPLEACPDSFAYRARKFLQRNTTAVASAAFVLLVITGLITFFVVRLTAARNIAVLEAERTKGLQNFTFNLVNGGDKDAGPSEGLRVDSLIDRGVVEARSLSNEPAVQATLYQTLGVVYQNLGNSIRPKSCCSWLSISVAGCSGSTCPAPLPTMSPRPKSLWACCDPMRLVSMRPNNLFVTVWIQFGAATRRLTLLF